MLIKKISKTQYLIVDNGNHLINTRINKKRRLMSNLHNSRTALIEYYLKHTNLSEIEIDKVVCEYINKNLNLFNCLDHNHCIIDNIVEIEEKC